MKKLIFISGTPVSIIVGEKLNPKHYVDKGFEVEYWDLARIYYDEKKLAAYFGGNKRYRYQFPKENIFVQKSQVKDAFKTLNSDVVFCHVDFNQENDYWLRRLFKRYCIDYYSGPRRTTEYGCFQKNDTSGISHFSFKILSAFRSRARVGYIQQKICNILYNYTKYYQKPIFVAGSGTLGRNEMLKLTRSKKFVSVPSTDFAWLELPKLISTPYCTYVDDAVIYSPDQSMTKGKSSTCHNLTEYSKNICKVFDTIEKTLGCKVVVAASRKYKYPDSKLFGGREIFYGKTNQLIQHSSLVVGHASSGTWQAIVSSKAIILLWDPSFIKAKNVAVRQASIFFRFDSYHVDGVDRYIFKKYISKKSKTIQ